MKLHILAISIQPAHDVPHLLQRFIAATEIRKKNMSYTTLKTES